MSSSKFCRKIVVSFIKYFPLSTQFNILFLIKNSLFRCFAMWNKNNENAIYCTNWLHTVQLLRKKSSNPIPNESQLKKPHKKPNNSYKPKRKGKKPLSIPHPPKPSARVIVPAAESWPRFSDAEKPLFRVPRRRGARWGPAPLTCEKPSGGRSARRVDVLWKQGGGAGAGGPPDQSILPSGTTRIYLYIYVRVCVYTLLRTAEGSRTFQFWKSRR